MSASSQILLLLTSTVFSVLIMLLWLRFLMQLADVDYYNPMTQFVARVTTPLVTPLRRLAPVIGRADLAPLLLIVIIKLVSLALTAEITGQVAVPALLIVNALFGLLLAATNFFFWLILAMVILSWVALAQQGGMNPALQPIFELAELVLAPCRRLLPALGGFDLSPIIAFLLIQVAEILIKSAYQPVLSAVAGA